METTDREEPKDLDALKAKHPEAYAAWKQEGIECERERVCAHLEGGEMAAIEVPRGLKIALEAIRSGEAMTPKASMRYALEFNGARERQRAREELAADEAALAVGANHAKHAGDIGRGEEVVSEFEELVGVRRD